MPSQGGRMWDGIQYAQPAGLLISHQCNVSGRSLLLDSQPGRTSVPRLCLSLRPACSVYTDWNSFDQKVLCQATLAFCPLPMWAGIYSVHRGCTEPVLHVPTCVLGVWWSSHLQKCRHVPLFCKKLQISLLPKCEAWTLETFYKLLHFEKSH